METVTLNYQQIRQLPRWRWLPALALALVGLVVGLLMLQRVYERLEAFLPHEDWIGQVMVGAMFLPVWIKGRGVVRFSVAAAACVLISLGLHFFDESAHDLSPVFHMRPEYGRAWAAAASAVGVLVAWFMPQKQGRTSFLARLAMVILATALLGLAVADWMEMVDAFSESKGLPLASGDYIDWALLVTPWIYVAAVWASAWWLDAEGFLRRTRWRDGLMWALTVVLVLSAVSYYESKPRIALYSLAHDGPFTTSASEEILEHGGIPDSEIWRLIEERLHSGHVPHWMRWAIRVLVHQNQSNIAHFSQLLQDHPRSDLAEYLAGDLAVAKRYETIPILLRVSLFDRDGICAEAVVSMGAPQAAWAALAYDMEMFDYRGSAFHEEIRLSANERKFYADMLGGDAGEDISNWLRLLRKNAHGRKAGIPDEICDEADRIVQCFDSYLQARTDLEHFVAGKLLEAAATRPGLDPADLSLIDSTYPELVHPNVNNRKLATLIWEVWDHYAPGHPTGEVMSTDELEKGVEKYVAKVRKTIGAS